MIGLLTRTHLRNAVTKYTFVSRNRRSETVLPFRAALFRHSLVLYARPSTDPSPVAGLIKWSAIVFVLFYFLDNLRRKTREQALKSVDLNKLSLPSAQWRTFADAPIVIFGRKSCPFCVSAEALVREGMGMEPLVVSTTNDLGDKEVSYLRDITTMSTVPIIFMRGKLIGGYSHLAELYQSGGAFQAAGVPDPATLKPLNDIAACRNRMRYE